MKRMGRNLGIRGSGRRSVRPITLLGIALACAGAAIAQNVRPVYLDDSPLAEEALVRVGELASIGNREEAVRVLQQVLEGDGSRLIPAEGEEDLFIPIRRHVHDRLLGDPALLESYRALHSDMARSLLDAGLYELVERDYLLTSAGFEATLRLAQTRFESAQFASAMITLEQLERHPDRNGLNAADAAALLSLVSQYLGANESAEGAAWLRERSAERVGRWRTEAGLGDIDGEQASDLPEIPRSSHVFERGPGVDLPEILPEPLNSSVIGDGISYSTNGGNDPSGAFPPGAGLLFAAPVASDDTIFINDGETMSAWRRFTLDRIWRAKTPDALPESINLGTQNWPLEPTTVVTDGEVVVGLTGLYLGAGSRNTRPRAIIARSAATGELLWLNQLADIGVSDIDSSLTKGPLLVSEGVVVFAVEKSILARRLDSASLIGLSVRDGSLLWQTPLAASGTFNFQTPSGVNDGRTARGGVVYAVDKVGFVAAIEAATGRPKWIRRFPTAVTRVRRDPQPWKINIPVLEGGRLYVMAPDRTAVLELDAETGAELTRIPASRVADADYLLTCAGMLIAVSANNVYGVPLEEIGTNAQVRTVAMPTGGRARGRVIVSDGLLLVPTIEGAELFDPTDQSTRPVSSVELTRPGATLPIEGELIVVDDSQVHTYLVWDVAERLLRERMEASSDAPEPAITYAELSYRAGRAEGILPAVDRALDAIDADPLSEQSERATRRLFDSLMRMVEPPPDANVRSSLEPELRGELITRMSRCAGSPGEQASLLLTSGSHHEGIGKPLEALDSFQRVLDDPELAGSVFERGSATVSADYEATRRLRMLVSREGRQIYGAFEIEAERQLEAITNELDPEPFERLARRFPVARAGARAWNEAAKRHERRGRPQLAALSLEEGLSSARDALDPGDPLLAELAGRLVELLIQARQYSLALATLDDLARQFPELRPTSGDTILDLETLTSEIRENMRDATQRPVIGPAPTDSRVIAGWSIVPTFYEESPRVVTDAVMMASRDDGGTLGLWRTNEAGDLELAWSVQTNDTFLWIDRTGVMFAREVGQNGAIDYRFIRRDIRTGTEMWATPAFRSVVPALDIDERLARGVQNVPHVSNPLNEILSDDDPGIPFTSLAFQHNSQTLVLMDQIGRAAAFDLRTGRTLWNTVDVVPQLHDMHLANGVLIIGGAGSKPNLDLTLDRRRNAAQNDQTGMVRALDVRNGQELFRLDVGSRVRWVRVAPEGFALIGLDQGIASYDMYRNEARWTTTHDTLRMSAAVWSLPGRLIIRRSDQRLIQLRTVARTSNGTELNLRGLTNPPFGKISVTQVGADDAAIWTRRGIALYDDNAELSGLTTSIHTGEVTVAGFGADYVPTLQLKPGGQLDRATQYVMTTYDLQSLRAVSQATVDFGALQQISATAIIDGKVLLSGGSITTVIDMPVPEEPELPEVPGGPGAPGADEAPGDGPGLPDVPGGDTGTLSEGGTSS